MKTPSPRCTTGIMPNKIPLFFPPTILGKGGLLFTNIIRPKKVCLNTSFVERIQARRRTIGCGRRSSVSAIRGIGVRCSGKPVVACPSSGLSSCNRRVSVFITSAFRNHTMNTARPGDHRFAPCTRHTIDSHLVVVIR